MTYLESLTITKLMLAKPSFQTLIQKFIMCELSPSELIQEIEAMAIRLEDLVLEDEK